MVATEPQLRHQTDMSDTIAAATVIIIRDLPQDHEVLMVQRHTQLAFAGGALVFPGGRVDRDDHLVAASMALDNSAAALDAEDAAGRVAAIRESLEESGIALGITGLATTEWENWRSALHSGVRLSELLSSADARVDLAGLIPFARWVPHTQRLSHIFDTRFYLARMPDNAPALASADGSETVRLMWKRPADVITEADSGNGKIIFPTRRNLERLAAHANYAALEAHARATPITKITPYVEEREGGQWLVIPQGLGYPVTGEPVETALRG